MIDDKDIFGDDLSEQEYEFRKTSVEGHFELKKSECPCQQTKED